MNCKFFLLSLFMFGGSIVIEGVADSAFESFRFIVETLSADQAENSSQALLVCKEKLVSAKKVPAKELAQLLPDICVYIKRLTAQDDSKAPAVSVSAAPNNATPSTAQLAQMQQTLNQLLVELDTSWVQLSDSMNFPPEAGIDGCLLLGLRQVLCLLDAKLTTLLTAMNSTVVATQNSVNTLAQNQQQAFSGQDAVLGSLADISLCITTPGAVDAQQATIIQWLKTIARQILIMQSSCWDSCVEPC